MVKKILLVMTIGIICGLSYITVYNYFDSTKSANEVVDNTKLFHAKMAFYANSLEEVYNQSPIIIEATVGNNVGEVAFGPESYFTFTEVNVDNIIKGDGLVNYDKINIIQTKYLIEDPVLENGLKKILFLVKYDCKEYADNDYTYACVGGYQGIYNINKNGKISNSLKMNDEVKDVASSDTVNTDKNVVETDIKNMVKDFAGSKTKKEFINEIKKFE